MVVRMRETRVLCQAAHNPSVLFHGKEYDLPKEYAAYLILEKKADFMPGRLRGTRHREFQAPAGPPTRKPAQGKQEQKREPENKTGRKVVLLGD